VREVNVFHNQEPEFEIVIEDADCVVEALLQAAFEWTAIKSSDVATLNDVREVFHGPTIARDSE
jgi:hypothetical protein